MRHQLVAVDPEQRRVAAADVTEHGDAARVTAGLVRVVALLALLLLIVRDQAALLDGA